MEEWKEYRLGEIAEMKYGKLPNKFAGCKGQIPIWSGYRVVGHTNSVNCKKGTAIVVARGVGGTGDVKIAKEDCFLTNLSISISLNEKICKPLYFYYKYQTKNLKYLDSGSAQSQITIEDLKRLQLNLPPISYQNRVIEFLSPFYDKIEVNRKINSNLEEQAKALFKSWFIDFEPFRDGKFVESELGKIPEGWKIGRYDNIVVGTIAGDWGKENSVGNYLHEVTCIRGCDFQDIKNGLIGNAPTRFILEKNFKNKRFASHDILVEISGGTQTVSTGRVCPISQKLLDRYNSNVVCTNFCRVVRPTEGYSAFAYYSWLYKYDHKVMFGYENGTSGIKNFRLNDFLSMEPLIIPPENIVIEFQNFIDSINSQIQTRGAESSKLANIRDTLLPKLMSGEIDVR